MNHLVSPPRYIWLFFLTAVLIMLLSAIGQTAVTPQAQADAGQPAPNAANLFAEYDQIVVRAYYQDRQALNALAGWKEPWTVNLNDNYAVVEATAVEYDYLLAAGYELVIEYELTIALNHPADYLPGQIMGIPGYPCYRTVEETYATAEALAADYPHLAEWILIGSSWEKVNSGGMAGYDLMVLKLTNSAIPGPKPGVFIMAAVHAREYTTAELVTRFAEYLIANYGVDADVTWMLDHHEFHLMLQANPDGRKRAESGISWRKNANNNYCANTNFRGADLNRNFGFAWNICGGGGCSSGNACNDTYRGPSAASEPETYSIENYVRSVFPDQRDDPLDAPAPDDAMGIFMDIHSYSELVLWPWGFTPTPAPNAAALQTLGRKFAYFNGYYPTAAIGLYPTDGTTEDFGYGELGLAAFTFELGTAFFQSCSFFESNIIPGNMPALLYAGKVARTPYLTPAGRRR
jgi:carboxypeptidase T